MHECEYYLGQISDVTIRKIDGVVSIHCKKCGGILKEDEIDPKTYNQIKINLENKKGGKNDRTRTSNGRNRRRN